MLKLSSIISTGLILTNGVLGFDIYAYPIAESYDRSTTLTTGKKLQIEDEMFFRLCYQKLPKHAHKNKDFVNYQGTNSIRLMERAAPCDKEFEPEWDVFLMQLFMWMKKEPASRLKKRLFKPELIVSKENADKESTGWLENFKERHGVSDEDVKQFQDVLQYHSHHLMAFPDAVQLSANWRKKLETTGPLVLSLRNELVYTPAELSPLSLKPFNSISSIETGKDTAIYFNTNLQMGDLTLLEGERVNRGMGSVDFYIDRNQHPDIDLFACREKEGSKNLFLYAGPKGSTSENPGNCFRVMLTTSQGQLAHLIDLWNQRQSAWTEAKVNLRMTPRYISDYVLVEKRVNKRPIIYKRDDPNKTPIDLANIKHLGYNGKYNLIPQKINDDIVRIVGVTRILDLERSDANYKMIPGFYQQEDLNAGEVIETLDGADCAVPFEGKKEPGNEGDGKPIAAEELIWFDNDGVPSSKSQPGSPGHTSPKKDQKVGEGEKTKTQASAVSSYLRLAVQFVGYLKENSYTMDDVLEVFKAKGKQDL